MRTTLALLALLPLAPLAPAPGHAPAPACAADNAGLSLPDGFCATLFADQLGIVRHLVALPNGD
ncbi:MAG: glucose dehydrogenase, partial [Gemmatimonadota bacterium]